MKEWKIQIASPGYKLTRDVYIFRETFDRKIEVMNVGIVEDGVASKPSLELNDEQLQAFAEALNSIGIKPQQGYVEGKLEATESHLKDMRKLLKLTY